MSGGQRRRSQPRPRPSICFQDSSSVVYDTTANDNELRRLGIDRDDALRVLVSALAKVYPHNVFDDIRAWPRARRLDALAFAIINEPSEALHNSRELSYLLDQLGLYRAGPLGAYDEARQLFERAIAIREKALGPYHEDMAQSLNDLGYVLRMQGDLQCHSILLERALTIREKSLGPSDPETARSLNNLGQVLQDMGDPASARPYVERALAIREKALGPNHPSVALSLNNLGVLSDSTR